MLSATIIVVKIMIDYIKCQINGCNVQQLLNNPLLDFHRCISESTGLIDTKTISQYNFCSITVYDSGVVIFNGSIHKLYNSLLETDAPNKMTIRNYNGYNGNQFRFPEIKMAIEHLEKLFKVRAEQMKIQNIELGQNLITSFDPQVFIKGLLMHMGQPFEYKFSGNFAQSFHSHYSIKIYNKSKQYNLPLNTLRFEIKIKKMQCQSKTVALRTLADIAPDSMQRAFNYITSHLRRVMYFDNTLKKHKLSSIDNKRIKDYANQRYWLDLKPNKRDEKKKNLNKIILNHSKNIKDELIKELNENRVMFYHHSDEVNRVIDYTSSIR